MMIRRNWMLLCLGAVLAAGCRTGSPTDFTFDRHGWGGPDPQYQWEPARSQIELESGTVFHDEFRWQNGSFSLEFLDKPDQVWGIVLTDFTFRDERRAALERELIEFGSEADLGHVGRDPGIDKVWPRFCVARMTMKRGGRGRSYKVLECWWHQEVVDGHRNVRLQTTHDLRVLPNEWNRLSVTVREGRLTLALNGRPVGEPGAALIEPRADGRVGFFVEPGTGPLLLRRLQFDRE